MPFFINKNFENQLYDWLSSIQSWVNIRPVNLGGTWGPGGGSGWPPGGFIGYLPQSRVSYDTTEVAASGLPASGWSLVDNLKHIRYRLNQLEGGSGVGFTGFEVQKDDVQISDSITILNFEGDSVSVTESPPGKATVVISYTASGMPAGNSVVSETLFSLSPASGVSNSYSRADHTHGTPKQPTRQVVFSAEGNLIVDSGRLRLYNEMGINFHISKIFLAVSTPPTGSGIKVSILNKGSPTCVDPNKAIIPAGSYTGTSVFVDNPDFNDTDYLTMNIEYVGTTFPGADLTAHVVLVDVNS